MKTYTHFEQNSLEWMAARAGVVTASEVSALVSPLGKVRTGDGVTTYLAQKVAETWIGGPIAGDMTMAMDMGHILEAEAINTVAFEIGLKIDKAALVTDDAGRIGCSPDGLVGTDGGVEIKSPEPKNAVKYLLAGVVPPDYVAQVQFSLYVTKRAWWKFVSYRRGMPLLIVHVEPDATMFDAFDTALDTFLPLIDAAIAKITALNNGVVPKKNAFREGILNPKPQPKREPTYAETTGDFAN